MQIINEAKDRVCLSLLNQVSACERLLEVAEQKDNKIRTKDLFLAICFYIFLNFLRPNIFDKLNKTLWI